MVSALRALYEEAVRQAEFSRALGQDCLFVSALVSPMERYSLVGRIQREGPVSLSDQQFEQMAQLLERIARLWKEYGIILCFHPHVGTYVEAPHEIEKLMDMTDPELVCFGPDTGHILFGGGDPVELIERYTSRVGALHVKDVRKKVVEQVRQEELDYRQACARGVLVGRNILFPGERDPAAMAAAVARIVHDGVEAAGAVESLKDSASVAPLVPDEA